MLAFFRKYQSIIYVFVTAMIVISFSFFGTYNTIVSNPVRDQIVFTAVDGTSVKRSDLDEMVLFISTDSQDKLLFGGAWGPNFLNDGVIRKDLLATGVGEVLALGYISDLEEELTSRQQKEKAFIPYVHPQVGFISAEQVWANYAPAIKSNLDALREARTAADPLAIHSRTQLYLAQIKFPGQFLNQVLQHQEKQFNFVEHDWDRERADLSLFGYHTVEDWFGPRFVRLSAEFIINAAKIAEAKGYEVSREEALADLLRNNQASYEQNVNNPNIGVANSRDYFDEQLRRMGMDQNQAVKVWQQVLLYRRLFSEVGNTVFVDPLLYEQFNGYAKEAVSGDLYRLPRELQLSDARALQKLELYLNSVSKRSESDVLMPPHLFLSPTEVARKSPQLVQKRYLLKVASLDKATLQGKVSLRDTWNWETDHWDSMTKQFPELGVKNAETREERFAALEALDDRTRARADAFARAVIVDENPAWREDALNKASEKTMTVGFSSGVPSPYFEGLEDGNELVRKLNKSGEEPLVFSADGRHYYKITVLDKSGQADILTFAEANRQGILDQMLDSELANYYRKNREGHEEFRKEDGSWKPIEDVKVELADLYLASILKAIHADLPETKMTAQQLAPLRFHSYLQKVRGQLEKDPTSSGYVATEPESKTDGSKLTERPALADQWKLVKEAVRLKREDGIEDSTIFSLVPNSWSTVRNAPNGDLSFIHVEKVGESALDPLAAAQKLNELKQLIASEAQRNYMAQVVEELKVKNAISLAYLKQPIETIEVPLPQTEEFQ